MKDIRLFQNFLYLFRNPKLPTFCVELPLCVEKIEHFEFSLSFKYFNKAKSVFRPDLIQATKIYLNAFQKENFVYFI